MALDVPRTPTPAALPVDPPAAAGASALTRYRAELAAERPRRLIVRGIATAAAAVVVGLLDWRLGGTAALAVAGADLARARVRGSAAAWRKGARGERATARMLAPLAREGYAILHDRAVPSSQANIDHLVIGPTGVWVIDTKRWDRRTRIHGYGRAVWIGRRPATSVLRGLAYEYGAVDAAARHLTSGTVGTAGLVAVHGPRLPHMRRPLKVELFPMLRARQVPAWVRQAPAYLSAQEVAALAAFLDQTFPPHGTADR